MAAKANSKEAKNMQEFTYKQQEYGRMIKRSYFLFNDLGLVLSLNVLAYTALNNSVYNLISRYRPFFTVFFFCLP